MQIHNTLEAFKTLGKAVVTTGTFDGVHLGHKKIINRLLEIAVKEKGESVIITFSPHPRMALFPDDNNLKLLNTQEEKIELLAASGIHHLVILHFTKEFSRLSSMEYVRDILVNKIGTKKLVIGYNHQFGRNREGGFEQLKEYGFAYGFDVEEIPALDMGNVDVSSTKIRQALLVGDVETANRYLGYNYMLSGTVVHSSEIGRSIGFPTANIIPTDKYKLVPADAVYAGNAIFEAKEYKGMLNIGVKPTVNNQNRRSIEAHLFDFNEDIYGKTLKVVFKKRLREEKKFASLDALKKQLEVDKKNAITA